MFFKDKQIVKEGNKTFEKCEVDKTEVQKQLDLLDIEEKRRVKEIQAEFKVKKDELNKYLL